MFKLIDYFGVVGYDLEQEIIGSNIRCGRIIQRFPEDDLVDNEFDNNVQCFCQPHGWKTYSKQEAPTFFVSVLTDIRAQRRYCACLTFLEPLTNTQNHYNHHHRIKSTSLQQQFISFDEPNYDADDQEESLNESEQQIPIGPSRLYAPKSLILISRLDYFELFKSLLSLIYGIYMDNRDFKLESVIANALTVQVPSPGSGLSSAFTLGADDKHTVQSCASLTVPNTSTCVYTLFKELGINHVLKLVCAVLSDFKILFFSRSYNKLTEACSAIESLLFPLKYAGVYVPILPCFGSFLEFPSAPTPYIIGIHSSYRHVIEQMHGDCLNEVIKVDLDGSSVSIPLTVDEIANLPTNLHESTINLLFSILKPDVLKADQVFGANALVQQRTKSATSLNNQEQQQEQHVDDPIWLDKQIRAVFVRLYAQLFAGYRYCLLIVRINPKPVICFHKANFLGHHDLIDNEFMNRLLDSMSFLRFIEERGPPYRYCDIFDEIYACVQSQLRDEIKDQELIQKDLLDTAEKLFKYEYPNTQFDGFLNLSRKNNTNRSSTTTQQSIFTQPCRSHSKLKLPSSDAFTRIHFQAFPLLDSNEIAKLLLLAPVTHTLSNNSLNGSNCDLNQQQQQVQTPRSATSRPYLVPYGPPIETVNKIRHLNPNSIENTDYYLWNVSCARKLELVSTCVNHIFDNNFKDAKKNLNSAFRALKDPRARLHLCKCLQKYVKKNQVILNNEQFDFIAKLLNEALQSDSSLDEFGVAYSVLPLASAFYRKLNNGTVDQCIYTKLQAHSVWDNMQFWEMSFYTDVQRSIRPVYLTNEEFDAEQAKVELNTNADRKNSDSSSHQTSSLESSADHKATAILSLNMNLHSRPAEKTALEICGEQMERFASYAEDAKENFIRIEQGIIRSHVLHYITQMVNMKIPFDISKNIASSQQPIKSSHTNHKRNQSQSMANGSVAHVNDDVESIHTENDVSVARNADNLSIYTEDSGYENGICAYSNGIGEAGYSVWKFVSKFVDRVCVEGYLNDTQKQSLHNILTEVVSMQISTLETVYLESKRIPPRIKPKLEILKPDYFLPCEHVIEPSPLRCYLVPDGREEVTGINGGPILVPAEGILILTNYRIIYRGIPTDPLVSDSIITRAFPISALSKEKKLSGQFYSENSNSCLHDGVQMRSCTFQLIRVFFDEEVSSDKIEKFRQMLHKLRYPHSILDFFCFTSQLNGTGYYVPTISIKNKEKHSDALRHFAKNTLRKAGLMPRVTNRKVPLSARTPELIRKNRSPKSLTEAQSGDASLTSNLASNSTPIGALDSDEESLAIIDENDSAAASNLMTIVNNDNKSLERWAENALAYRDYIRQGLINAQGNHKTLSRQNNDSFRLSTVNSNYQFCRSYPAMFVVPRDTTDECIRKNARCHRLNRLPIIVWRNSRTRALLLRSSSFHGKGIIAMLMKGQTTSSTSSDTSASMEQDKYIMDIVKLTKPLFVECLFNPSNNMNTNDATTTLPSSITPLTHRRRFASKIERAVQNFKPNFHLNQASNKANTSTLRRQQQPQYQETKSNHLQLSLYSSSYDNSSQVEYETSEMNDSFNSVKKGSPLYIICERAQIRTFRSEACKAETRYSFIPVDIYEVRETKNCFKKFCRACLSSTPIDHSETNTGKDSASNQPGFWRHVHDSKWFEHLQKILSISNLIVERMEEGSSVMICLEDGWDITAQLTSIVEILQDPYYRTIEGFSVLIEREWLSMGHRFTRRNNHTIDDQTGFAPIFLQFLDCVHQILSQYPHEFEFNEFYLEFLAYHYVSNRFKTFLLDSEYERVQFGLTPDQKYANRLYTNTNHASQSMSTPCTGVTTSLAHVTCIWEYVQKVHYNVPKFYNFYYVSDPNYHESTLTPSSDLSSLKLWRYYLKESLCTGPLYDLDLIFTQSSDDCWYPLTLKNAIDYYEDMNTVLPTQFEILLKDLLIKLKAENPSNIVNLIGYSPTLPLTWKSIWDYFTRHVSKQLTKSIQSNVLQSKVSDMQHNFERCLFTSPHNCHVCGLLFKSSCQFIGFKCKSCYLCVHEKCLESISTIPCHSAIKRNSQNLSDLKSASSNGRYSLNKQTKIDNDIGSACKITQGFFIIATFNQQRTLSPTNEYDGLINWTGINLASSEHQTYAGHLKKQGALFKQWKERYFVLDSVKHQLRYYDTPHDKEIKGMIDLSDVEAITQYGSSLSVSPSTSDLRQLSANRKLSSEDKCCFELKTSKRVYYFCAKSQQDALKWRELIESCIDSMNSKKTVVFACSTQDTSPQSTYDCDFSMFHYNFVEKSNNKVPNQMSFEREEIKYDKHWTKTDAIKRFTQNNPQKYNLYDPKIYHFGKALTALSPARIKQNLNE